MAYNDNFQAIVIGGGLMGSAAAWALATRGHKVLLLEQQGPQYRNGSSYGESRITRSLDTISDIFSYVQKRTVAESHKLVQYLNGSGTAEKHSMEDIYTTAPLNYIYYPHHKHIYDELIGRKDEKLDYAGNATEAREKFGIAIGEGCMLIRELNAYTGTFNPRVMIQKLHLAIGRAGGEVRYQQQLLKLQIASEKYILQLLDQTGGDQYMVKTEKLVMATGPYTPRVLHELAPCFKALVKPHRVYLVFFKPDALAYHRLTKEHKARLRSCIPVIDYNELLFFVKVEKTDTDGLPVFKTGGHALRFPADDPDQVWQQPLSQEEQKLSLDNLAAYFRRIQLPLGQQELNLHGSYSCVYSMTDTEIPFVTHLVDADGKLHKNAVVIAGMSGIGAKGCLAYGAIAADLLVGHGEQDALYQKTVEMLGPARIFKLLNSAG